MLFGILWWKLVKLHTIFVGNSCNKKWTGVCTKQQHMVYFTCRIAWTNGGCCCFFPLYFMFCLQFVVFCLLLAKIKTWCWKAMCSCDKPTPRKWNWTCVHKVLKTWIQSRTDVQQTNIFYLMRLNLVRIVIQNMTNQNPTKLPKYLLSWLWTFYFHYAPNFSHLTSLRL